METLIYLAPILITLLIIILYFVFQNKLNGNLKKAFKYAVFSMAFILSFYIVYIIVFVFTFGASFFQSILLLLPWVVKGENAFNFPLYLGGFVFALSWSILTLSQVYHASQDPSYSRPKNSYIILAVIIFFGLFLLSILLAVQWMSDISLVRNRFNDVKLVSSSKDRKQLRERFEVNIASHDPDIKFIIAIIAGNRYAGKELLLDIYNYALSLKQNNTLRKSILDALANNPSAPAEILKGILKAQEMRKTSSNQETVFSPYGSLATLAENSNTASTELKEIYMKISKPKDSVLSSNLEMNSKTRQIYEALAKNPNTPPEILNEMYSKLANEPKITYIFVNFSENPNLPMDVLKGIIEKINLKLSTATHELDAMEFGFISSIISNSLKKKNIDPAILQILINLPDCNIRSNIFNSLHYSESFPEIKLDMLNGEQDLGNQLSYKAVLGQAAFFLSPNAPIEQPLTNSEGAELSALRLQISSISDPQHLEDIFNSINNTNIRYHLLPDFSMNCYVGPGLIKKMFSIVQGAVPFSLKLNTLKALALNPNTPYDILRKIIETSLREIQNRNIIWTSVINLMSLNPNFPVEDIPRLIFFPSCSIRMNLARNPVVSFAELDKLKNDPDYSVRITVADILRDPTARKIDYSVLPGTPTCEKFKNEMKKLTTQKEIGNL